jgi:hypothetical protein
MIKIRVSPTVSPFQVDFPSSFVVEKAKAKGKEDTVRKIEKRSVKDGGSINFRPGAVRFLTNDEWEYLKKEREDLIGHHALILLDDKVKEPKKAKKEESKTAEAGSGGKKDKDSKKKK